MAGSESQTLSCRSSSASLLRTAQTVRVGLSQDRLGHDVGEARLGQLGQVLGRDGQPDTSFRHRFDQGLDLVGVLDFDQLDGLPERVGQLGDAVVIVGPGLDVDLLSTELRWPRQDRALSATEYGMGRSVAGLLSVAAAGMSCVARDHWGALCTTTSRVE